MNFPIIDVYNHPHYGDSVRYENYVELQEVAEKLEARHTALREAVAKYLALRETQGMKCVDDMTSAEYTRYYEHLSAARAEVDRLLNDAANCKGEG